MRNLNCSTAEHVTPQISAVTYSVNYKPMSSMKSAFLLSQLAFSFLYIFSNVSETQPHVQHVLSLLYYRQSHLNFLIQQGFPGH